MDARTVSCTRPTRSNTMALARRAPVPEDTPSEHRLLRRGSGAPHADAAALPPRRRRASLSPGMSNTVRGATTTPRSNSCTHATRADHLRVLMWQRSLAITGDIGVEARAVNKFPKFNRQ